MKRLSFLLLLFVIFSVASCDWLVQDSDTNNQETSEVGKADEANEEPPGDGVPSY